MLSYLKENGFSMTIHIETYEFEDPDNDFNGYESIVVDENHNEIGRFVHQTYSGRIIWVNGFFTALNLKNNK